MKKLTQQLLIFMVLITAPNVLFAFNSYYVDTSGSQFNLGTLNSPWNLEHALSHPSIVQAGDTIWIRQGTYSCADTSYLQGSPAANIVVRNYNNERVILKSPCQPGIPNNAYTMNTLTVAKPYVTFWGLEITSDCTNRKSYTWNFINDYSINKVNGVNVPLAHHVKLINLIVHNVSVIGIGSWAQSVGSEIYGCLVFNNGCQDSLRGHGHAIYSQNKDTASVQKVIKNNFLFNNFGDGLNIYSTGGFDTINGVITPYGEITNYLLEDNVVFNGGSISDSLISTERTYNMLVGSNNLSAKDITIKNNIFYRDIDGKSIKLGNVSNDSVSSSIINENVHFNNNVVYGGTSGYAPVVLKKHKWFEFNYNTIINQALNSWDHGVFWENNSITHDSTDIKTTFIWDHNYYNNRVYKIGLDSIAKWKNDMQKDSNSTFSTNALPSGSWKIVQNQYEPKKLYVTILNWEKLDSVEVNLDSFIAPNSIYKISDIQNIISATPFSLTGNYVTGGIQFPMNLTNTNDLYIDTVISAVKHTNSYMGTFIVEFDSVSTTTGSVCDAPTGLDTISTTTHSAVLHWNSISSSDTTYTLRFRPSNSFNAFVTMNFSTSTNSFTLNNLTPNTQYDVQLMRHCANSLTSTSTWCNAYLFSTQQLPMCLPPTGLNISINGTNVFFSWTSASYANLYHIEWKKTTDILWSTKDVTNIYNVINLDTTCVLAHNTDYMVRIKTYCDTPSTQYGHKSIFSNIIYFTAPPHIVANIISNNVSCNGSNDGKIIVSSVAGSSGSLEYSIDYSSFQPNNTFSNLSVGTYTIITRDLQTCLDTAIITITQPTIAQCSCDSTLANDTTTVLVNNGFSNSLGTNIVGKNIFVDGTLTIDNNITFDDCDFYFTANSQIIVQAGKNLTIKNGSTLQSACGDYWKGIIADDPTAEIVIDNCTIQDMSEGVLAKNNATIQVTDNTFKNNANSSIGFENMTLQTNSKVWNNTFTSDASMIAIAGQTLPKHGVEIVNSDFVTIGHETLVANGNTFTNLYNGIKVFGDNTIAGSGNTIALYNNKFEDIHGDESGIDVYTNAYSKKRGSAIYILYNLGSFNANTIVKNYALTNVASFKNCDKGIVCNNSKLESRNLFMKDCTFGIMNNDMYENKPFVVAHNNIQNTMLGIECLFNSQQSRVDSNNIKASGSLALTPGQMGSDNMWARGIDVRTYTNGNNFSNNNSIQVRDNTITLEGYAGIGIDMHNTGAMVSAERNDIYINSNGLTNIVCGLGASTPLNGIALNNTMGSYLNKNYIHGLTDNSLLNPEREDIAGIRLNKSQNHTLNCNSIAKTRFGILAVGDCSTTPTATNGNHLYNHVMGWTFRHLGVDGTFGDVGDNATNNNNTFGGTGYASKVFRFCINPIMSNPEKIYTDTTSTLKESESSSYCDVTGFSDCSYSVKPNGIGATTFNCPSIITPILNAVSDPNYMELEEALMIANDTRIYTEFNEMTRWMDQKKLFDILTNDVVLRNSHVQLLNFYNDMLNNSIAEIKDAEIKLNDLLTAYTTNNSALINQRLQWAQNANNGINNEELQNQNEQLINEIYLGLFDGFENLSEGTIAIVNELANKCPYQEGSAVYKARTLNALFNPTLLYDDIKICNSVGYYRTSNSNNQANTKGLFGKENDFLKTVKPNNNSSVINTNEIKVYPNPANTILNIQYNIDKEASFTILDMLGRKIIETNLSDKSNYATIDVSKLTTGIYIYQLSADNMIFKSDKIVIE